MLKSYAFNILNDESLFSDDDIKFIDLRKLIARSMIPLSTSFNVWSE